MTKIYQKLKTKGISFNHVCEIGVYLPETSNIIDFIKDGIKTTLVEADPVTVEKIETYFKGYDITIHPVAVWDTNGTLQFSKAASSTFATDLPSSPALENDNHKIDLANTFEVPCRMFSDLDDGTIDLLSIDIEGCEWYVLKHLVSQPKIISAETHGKYYTNPFMQNIDNWVNEHGYELWYKDSSDSVYVKKGLFEVSSADRRETRLSNYKTSWKKFKRIFKKKH